MLLIPKFIWPQTRDLVDPPKRNTSPEVGKYAEEINELSTIMDWDFGKMVTGRSGTEFMAWNVRIAGSVM